MGRSYKAKIKKTKDSEKERPVKRDQAQKMSISHKEQERSGSRNTIHEDRPRKAKQAKARKVKQQKEEKAKQEKEMKAKQQKEMKSKEEKEMEAKQEEKKKLNAKHEEKKKKLKTVQDLKDREESTVLSDKSPVETAQPTFSELTDLKSSADDHLQTPYHLRFEAKIRAKVEAKKVWRGEPYLTDDSEDEDVLAAPELTDDSDDEQDGGTTFSELYYT